MIDRVHIALALALAACGPPGPTLDCIPIDEQLGVPIDRQWCEGEYQPSMLWQGEEVDNNAIICLLPESDGECKVCPADEVSAAVETKLEFDLAMYYSECTLEHWELGCMRTLENAKNVLHREPESCCFQVAVWGENCH